MTSMKHVLAAILGWCALSAVALAQSPSTVIHVINVKWKAEASPVKIKAAVDAVHQLPSKYPGIKRVWTENLKYQDQEGAIQAIVMEFESRDALNKHEDSPAQKWWHELYLPIREESHTHNISN